MYEDGTGLLSIGALSRLTGVSVKTIRNWSDQDLLPPAARTPAGYRLYGPDAPARLEIVRSLRELGIGTAAIRAVLHRERSLGDTAERWADALDAQIRTLRLQRSVLRTVAARGTAAEELPQMTRLARLSAEERRRIVADVVEDALDGVAAPAYRSGLLAATPDPPEDPTPEQLDAWVELAALVRDPELGAALRRLAEFSARTAPAQPTGAADAGDPDAADPAAATEAAVRVAELMRTRADAAVAAGIAPDSPVAEPVLAELIAAWIPTQATTHDPPAEDGPAARTRLLEQLETVAEPLVERYWQLLCTATGRPAPPRWGAAGTWTAAALRAHRTPSEPDRSAFERLADTDPERVLAGYAQVARDVGALVAAVRPDDLRLSTPCAGWTVRELLNHMVWENLMATSIAAGAPRGDHTADHLGDGPDGHIVAFEESARTALAVFTGSGMLHRTFGPYEAPGGLLVQQVTVELLAHGWDLARAVGAPTDLAPEVAAEVLEAARLIYGAAPRTEGSSFAPERPAPPGATAADRLAAYLGRLPD
ncbi:TIGR03086 family metal-binding protein [Streptomyces sp. GS7]|uniref:TIGR03086 family metal-binding protein n=1 Tax=Streptomyces sp. GS7 TaxID=2692234 RepID=UPI0013176F34|nr:TIGR03086 family metal-binding protein [Streptomyces sp. GS7]QHC26824.1 TIGR03086 family protein [Streptomyces sp. GS7]